MEEVQSILGSGRNPFSALGAFGFLFAMMPWGSMFDSLGYRSDVPFWRPGKDLWSQRALEKTNDYIAQGTGDWSRLARTLAMVGPIAVLGILFYGEDSIRNLGILDAGRIGGVAP